MTCRAKRPPHHDDGWLCTGEDLTVIAPATSCVPPLVIRRDLLPMWLTKKVHRELYEMCADRTGPYLDDGDHLHAALPHVPLWRRLLLRLGVGS